MTRLTITACLVLGAFSVFPASRLAYARPSSQSSHTVAHKPSAAKKKRHKKREPKQKAPTSDRIMEIQTALARNGSYQGEPTGKWDAATVAAMQKFQSDHGLDATGKIDALSLQKLGLGSEIAGVSAPRRVVRPSTNQPASGLTSPGAKAQPPKPTDTSTSVSETSSAPPTVVASTPSAPSSASTPKPATPPQPQ